MGFEQAAEPDTVDARIVGDHGEVLDAGVADRVHRVSAMPHRPKPPDMIMMPSLRTPARAVLASG
jgi:hypothetical protein